MSDAANSDANILPDSQTVNGPINVMRLEGKIHGINKVIYLFMDFHMDVESQTQCRNIFSKDIQKYLVDNFYEVSNKNSDKIYDFFLEIHPTDLTLEEKMDLEYPDYKQRYIHEVIKVFIKIFNFDPKKNKVSVNKLFKNVRLHFLDIRDYYKKTLNKKCDRIYDLARNFMKSDDIIVDNLDNIITLMSSIRDHLVQVISILEKQPNKIIKSKIIRNKPESLDIPTLQYLANKMRKMYKHDDVKKIMNMLMDDSIKNFKLTIKLIDDNITKFQDYSDRINKNADKLIRDENTNYLFHYGLSRYTIRNMVVDIFNSVGKLVDEYIIEFFARFVDVYFLRRFLDKDYITNTVVYTGIAHSTTYAHVLVKYFGFKVTHASYSKTKNMDKLTSEIKNKSLMEVQEFIYPTYLIQCSDMTKFPRNFE